MQQQQFEASIDRALETCRKLLIVKGGEYTGSADRLANFKRGSALTGCTPQQVLFIYLSKHYDAIATFIRDDAQGESRPTSEPIAGRIHDLINYLFLLNAMIEEGAHAE